MQLYFQVSENKVRLSNLFRILKKTLKANNFASDDFRLAMQSTT